jgi:hypothetical protein
VLVQSAPQPAVLVARTVLPEEQASVQVVRRRVSPQPGAQQASAEAQPRLPSFA